MIINLVDNVYLHPKTANWVLTFLAIHYKQGENDAKNYLKNNVPKQLISKLVPIIQHLTDNEIK